MLENASLLVSSSSLPRLNMRLLILQHLACMVKVTVQQLDKSWVPKLCNAKASNVRSTKLADTHSTLAYAC